VSTDDAVAAALAAAGLAGAAPGQTLGVGGPTLPGPADEEAAAEPAPRWPDGAATGVGSMPGADPREAATTVTGELPVLPYLPELPGRGVGADMIGRTAGLLVDIAVEVVPTGYRVTARPGRDHRRAVDLLRGDLDALEEACESARPEWVKLQVAGPWTLAAGVELHTGHRVLTDAGAVREFTASLLEGLRTHVAEVADRLGVQVLVQLDEPALPAVLAGALPTASGFGTVRAVGRNEAQDALRDLVSGLGVPVVVHCCADRPPIRLLADTGVAGIGIDATLPAFRGDGALPAALDAIGEVWDSGLPLLLGVVPAVDPARPVTSRELAEPVFDLADRLGFERSRLGALVVPTPTCGLAGATPTWARRALTLARELGEALLDPPEDADPRR
jgi:hypothetical protein